MEIGSEFWDAPLSHNNGDFSDENTQFVFSGRTALELVARDLIAERKIRSVCLPAYCCDSMIFPFEHLNLEIKFYDIQPSETGVKRIIPKNHGCDAVLLLDYFGFSQSETTLLAEHEHKHGTAVILDQVQSLYSESDTIQYADYSTTSWRKWFFSCAAAAKKLNGDWTVRPSLPGNAEYIHLRNMAAKQKAAYIHKGEGEKQAFLNKYSQAEVLLDRDYTDYAADPQSMDDVFHLNVPFLKKRRRENAKIIYDVLQTLEDDRIRPLFSHYSETDTPLFVPVLISPDIRTDLRTYLIQNQVYCPIHWTDSHTGGGGTLYAQELSLVCDQRYTIEDMEREMNLIKDYFTLLV